MGHHIDQRGQSKKKPIGESDRLARKNRASFKQYLRDLEEDLLEQDLNSDDEDPFKQHPED